MKRDLVIPISGFSIIAAEAYADELGVDFDFDDDGFDLRDFVRT